jgi:hypothetical protein
MANRIRDPELLRKRVEGGIRPFAYSVSRRTHVNRKSRGSEYGTGRLEELEVKSGAGIFRMESCWKPSLPTPIRHFTPES